MADQKLVVTSENPQGTLVDYTEAELAQREIDRARKVTEREAREVVATQKATDKANAKAKLIAGEALTEAEADQIVI